MRGGTSPSGFSEVIRLSDDAQADVGLDMLSLAARVRELVSIRIDRKLGAVTAQRLEHSSAQVLQVEPLGVGQARVVDELGKANTGCAGDGERGLAGPQVVGMPVAARIVIAHDDLGALDRDDRREIGDHLGERHRGE